MVKSFQYPKDLRLFKHEGLAYKFDITFSQKLSKDDLPELYIDIKKILLGAFELKQKTKFTLEEGRFTVRHPTLTRFFSLHYLLGLLIAPLSLIHIILLHMQRSRGPIRDQNDYYLPF